MQQNEENNHPHVKRYTAPVSRKPQVTGIDLEKAYKSLMQGYVDAHLRHQAKGTRPNGSKKDVHSVPPPPSKRSERQEEERP